jgi:uncharacterized damage-inducible protein DinB
VSNRCLSELFRGQGAHLDPVACVEDVPFSVAGKKVGPHSIWQIVWHLNYWIDYDLRRIQGEQPAYPGHAAESWPLRDGPESEEEWETDVRRFGFLIEKLVELSGHGPEFMNRQVKVTHPSHEKQSASVEAALWQTLAHNSYHIGQIALMRRMLGAWPPRQGSDTW